MLFTHCTTKGNLFAENLHVCVKLYFCFIRVVTFVFFNQTLDLSKDYSNLPNMIDLVMENFMRNSEENPLEGLKRQVKLVVCRGSKVFSKQQPSWEKNDMVKFMGSVLFNPHMALTLASHSKGIT